MCASMLAARRRLARDPAGRGPGSPSRAWSTPIQGTTIGVLMSATLPARLGEPSRALDRGPPAREPARAPARRARHARLPDAPQRARAGDPGRGDVHHRRPLRGPPAGARLVRRGAVRRALRGAAWRPPCCAPACRRAPRACTAGWSRRALARPRASGLRVFRSPRLGAEGGRHAARRLGAAVGLLLRAARGAGARLLTTSAPPPPSCSRSTSPRCCRSRRPTSACSRRRAWPCSPGPTGSTPRKALGYGIILQAVEIATAVIMGAPALVKEGLSWREVRLRALHTAPVSLGPAPRQAKA